MHRPLLFQYNFNHYRWLFPPSLCSIQTKSFSAHWEIHENRGQWSRLIKLYRTVPEVLLRMKQILSTCVLERVSDAFQLNMKWFWESEALQVHRKCISIQHFSTDLPNFTHSKKASCKQRSLCRTSRRRSNSARRRTDQRLQLRADLHQTICIVGVLLTSASTSALPMCVWIYLPIHIYVYISTSSIKHAICRFIQQQKRTHLSWRTYSSRSFPESTEPNITTISAFITNIQQIKQVSCSDLNTSSMRMTITASTTVVCSMVPALLNDKISISQLQPMNSSYAILTKKKT